MVDLAALHPALPDRIGEATVVEDVLDGYLDWEASPNAGSYPTELLTDPDESGHARCVDRQMRILVITRPEYHLRTVAASTSVRQMLHEDPEITTVVIIVDDHDDDGDPVDVRRAVILTVPQR